MKKEDGKNKQTNKQTLGNLIYLQRILINKLKMKQKHKLVILAGKAEIHGGRVATAGEITIIRDGREFQWQIIL